MNKKALLKAALVVVCVVVYITIACIAVETKSGIFIGLTIGPLVLIGLSIIGKEAYYYFNDK